MENLVSKLFVAAILASSSVVNAGLIIGGELLDQTGADFLEGQLGSGDLDFTNISNLDSGALASTWHADVLGKTNVLSIYDVTFEDTDYLIGGYSEIGHDGEGLTGIASTPSNFVFNLSLSLIHTLSAGLPWGWDNHAQLDGARTFATFGVGHDVYGGLDTLGAGAFLDGNASYLGGYTYGGSGTSLLDGGTEFSLKYFTVNGLESYTWAVASAESAPVPEPSIIALFGLGLVGLGFARRRRQA